MDFKSRSKRLEILDNPEASAEDLLGTFRFLEMTNRYFGGTRLVIKYLKRFKKTWATKDPIKILDVGSGTADIPKGILKWSAVHKIPVHVTALELNPRIIEMALERSRNVENLEIRQGDIFSLKTENASFDYVTASLLLHHIPDKQLPNLLKKMDQYAKRGLILSDLHRSLSSYWAVKLLAAVNTDEISSYDGPLSVRRAFTPEEFQHLADSNGLHYLTAKTEPFFRLSLTGDKTIHGK